MDEAIFGQFYFREKNQFSSGSMIPSILQVYSNLILNIIRIKRTGGKNLMTLKQRKQAALEIRENWLLWRYVGSLQARVYSCSLLQV